ncbi:MAG: prolipoprotein diacylglyceryl transferase [Candidatus Zixiibacteriota bacterium]
MLPELFHIGPLPIRGYGLMLALAFLGGILYVKKIIERDGKPFEPFLTMSYIIIFGGIIGGRLLYVLLHLSDFKNNWSASFNPFASSQFGISGLTLYGGIVLAVVGVWLYCTIRKLSILEVFDYFAAPLGLGIGFGRIGCWLNGCCFGTPTDLPWGVSFSPGSIPFSVFGDLHLHPAQLYSSLYGFGLFVLLHFLHKHKQFHGQVIGLLFMLEALFRFAIEAVRYYESAMYFDLGPIHATYNHLVSVGLFALGLSIYLWQWTASRKKIKAKTESL